jgi:hypothetical protein
MDTGFLDAVVDMALATQNTLDDQVVDPTPHQIHVKARGFKMLAEGGEGPFKALVVFFKVIILLKCMMLLINAIVSQLIEQI